MATPKGDASLSFEEHIKPLFRESDQRAMSFAFDLWSHQDVSQHADAIVRALGEGDMPCDGAWPQERIDIFKRWIRLEAVQ